MYIYFVVQGKPVLYIIIAIKQLKWNALFMIWNKNKSITALQHTKIKKTWINLRKK